MPLAAIAAPSPILACDGRSFSSTNKIIKNRPLAAPRTPRSSAIRPMLFDQGQEPVRAGMNSANVLHVRGVAYVNKTLLASAPREQLRVVLQHRLHGV